MPSEPSPPCHVFVEVGPSPSGAPSQSAQRGVVDLTPTRPAAHHPQSVVTGRRPRLHALSLRPQQDFHLGQLGRQGACRTNKASDTLSSIKAWRAGAWGGGWDGMGWETRIKQRRTGRIVMNDYGLRGTPPANCSNSMPERHSQDPTIFSVRRDRWLHPGPHRVAATPPVAHICLPGAPGSRGGCDVSESECYSLRVDK